MGAQAIFISYRRQDSAGHAGRLCDHLEAAFGAEAVFRDIEDIAAGADFVQTLHEQVDRCDVLLALIGPRWLSVTAADGTPRLWQAQDWVRLEIARALARGIRVIPVLLGGATMPAAQDLPEDLAALSRRNAMELRDAHFERDLEHLVRTLAPQRSRLHRYRGAIAALLAVLIGVGALVVHQVRESAPDRARQQLAQLDRPYTVDGLAEAAGDGDLRAVELYLDAGMAVDAAPPDGLPAIYWAVAEDQPKVVGLLLDRGALLSEEVLGSAIGREHAAVFDLLMERRPDRALLDAVLSTAVATGRLDFVQRLVEQGADVNAEQGRALVESARAGRLDLFDWLVARGADIRTATHDDMDLLHAAVSRGGAEADTDDALAVLGKVLAAGVPMDTVCCHASSLRTSPLLTAINRSRARSARVLLQEGASTTVASSGTEWAGYTPLMGAAERGLVALIDPLLAAGVAVDAVSPQGDTALTLATWEGHVEIVQRLLAAGAQVDHVGRRGLTSLMQAAYLDRTALIGPLLQAGAARDAAAADGTTALMFAVRRSGPDRTQTVEALLVAGADRNRHNEAGETALSIALARERRDLVRLLRAGPSASGP